MAQQLLVGDTNNLETLRSLVARKANEIDNNIVEIYTTLQTILSSGAWSGDAADNFFSNCKNSRDDLNNLVQFLNDYADLIGTVSSNVENLSSKISSICRG